MQTCRRIGRSRCTTENNQLDKPPTLSNRVMNSVAELELREFDDRFDEVNSTLLSHVASFGPKDSFVAFSSESFVKLAKLYLVNISSDRLYDLVHELITYIDKLRADENLEWIVDLAKLMVQTNKHITFLLVY